MFIPPELTFNSIVDHLYPGTIAGNILMLSTFNSIVDHQITSIKPVSGYRRVRFQFYSRSSLVLVNTSSGILSSSSFNSIVDHRHRHRHIHIIDI